MVSRNILDFAKRDRMLKLEDEKSKRSLTQSEIDELKELQKAETKVTYLVPYSQPIEAQLYNSMGITGNQVDQMNSYFNAGGASGSATVRTITKAQAQILMSNAGFSTEAELIADQKRLGYTLKITP